MTPADFEAPMLRLHARRVAGAYDTFGETVPPGAGTILKGDTPEHMDADNEASAEWCRRHDLEVVLVLNGRWCLMAETDVGQVERELGAWPS